MALSLKQLRYFVALVEARNFGRAADQVRVSQPALSVQIRELETALGGPLVERRARDVVPTPLGRGCLSHARRVLAEVAELERTAHRRGGRAMALSVGVTPTIAPYLLPDALARIRARGLPLEVQVREGPAQALLDLLEAGCIDAVVAAAPGGRSGLTGQVVLSEALLLAGTAEAIGRLSAAGPLCPDQIPQDQLLLPEEDLSGADPALPPGAGRMPASLATLAGLAAAGRGVLLLPEIAACPIRAAWPDLVLARFAEPEPGRSIGLFRRPGSGENCWAEDLAAVLAEAGQAALDRLRGETVHLVSRAARAPMAPAGPNHGPMQADQGNSNKALT